MEAQPQPPATFTPPTSSALLNSAPAPAPPATPGPPPSPSPRLDLGGGLGGGGLDNAEEVVGTTRVKGANFTIRKLNRPTLPVAPYTAPPPPPSSVTPATPAPPATTSVPSPPSPFPALHLTPLNDTFVPKQISLSPPGVRVKIGRQTNAKTLPNGTNGYFDSKVLSRMHAEVWSEDGKVYIKDVKSSNGTFINGDRLSAEAAESDVFELHTEDIVEFGIDIVSDDNKTIVHHKVAARVCLVMNAEDAAASSREFNNWYRNAGEASGHRRAAVKAQAPNTSSNGLSFEHVLNRLQGELQKSRDTGSNLGDLNSTLNEVQDTLGGGAPPPLPHGSRGAPPYISNGASKDVHAQSIAALQSQLNETQNSLAGHVGKIRDLEGLLAEHEVIKREVGSLRKQMEDAQRDMEMVLRGRSGRSAGRESPVAALLEAQEAADDDDSRSISSVDTVRINTADQIASLASSPRTNGILLRSPNGTPSDVAASSKAEDLAREERLQEQNAKLSTRLEALAVELDEAIEIGHALRSQHAEASSTIRALEDRVQGLEKAVEGRVAEVEGKALEVAETRWNGWRAAFEEGWKRERESWDVEREKLTAVVREWEERRASESEGSAWDAESGEESNEGEKEVGEKSAKGRKARPRRRRRSTASRVSKLALGLAGLASESDSMVGGATRGTSGAWMGGERVVPAGGSRTGYDNLRGQPANAPSQVLPYASAGAVVIIGVAAAWALSLKLKE